MQATRTPAAATTTLGRRALYRLAAIACAVAAIGPRAAQAYTINGTYYNRGTWTDSLYVSTTGYFINLSGGVLQSSLVMNAGKLENRLGGVVNNYTRLLNATVDQRQVLYNYGALNSFAGSSFENSASLYNYAGATLGSAAGASMVNLGFISNAGSWVNAGSFEQRYENITGAPTRKLTNSGSLVNSGTMTVRTKTTLENSGSFTNSGTLNSATTALSSSGSWLNSGALNLTGDLSVGTTAGLAILNNTGTLTNTGTLANVNGTVKNHGSLVNDGTINNATSNWIGDWGRFYNYAGASLVNHGSFGSNHVLDNAGTITNTGTLSVGYMLNNLAGATLTSAAGAAIKGATYNYGTLDNAGSIEVIHNYGVLNNHAGASQSNAQLDNYGTLTNEAGAGLSGVFGVTNAPGATLINRGSMYHWYADFYPNTTSNAGTLLNDGSLYNARTLYNSGAIQNAGSLAGTGSFVQTAGTTTNAGSLSQAAIDIQGGSFVLQQGSLSAVSLANAGVFQGAGTVNVPAFTNAGTVAPGASLGTLTITGNYFQQTPGLLNIELGGLVQGTGYDLLEVTGQVTLAGTLDVMLANGLTPALGASFDILHAAGGIAGTFDTLVLPTLASGIEWTVGYTGTDVWLQVGSTSPPVPEPGSFALFGLGLAGLRLLRRRG